MIYTLSASSCDRTFTNFLSRCQNAFGVTEESRFTSIDAGFLAGFARAHALSSYET